MASQRNHQSCNRHSNTSHDNESSPPRGLLSHALPPWSMSYKICICNKSCNLFDYMVRMVYFNFPQQIHGSVIEFYSTILLPHLKQRVTRRKSPCLTTQYFVRVSQTLSLVICHKLIMWTLNLENLKWHLINCQYFLLIFLFF
jgi:hypothetical protein